MGWYIGTMKSKLKNDIQKVIASCSSKKQNVYLTPLDVNLKKKNAQIPMQDSVLSPHIQQSSGEGNVLEAAEQHACGSWCQGVACPGQTGDHAQAPSSFLPWKTAPLTNSVMLAFLR